MSYDLMVFELSAAPRGRAEFLEWYEKQTQWPEGNDYYDPQVASPALQSWFREMIQFFPPMNGPYASADVDDPRITDHCIGMGIIYSEFRWSCANEAYAKTRELANKHKVGFFDVSAQQGEILFTDDSGLQSRPPKTPWWRFW